MPHFADGFTVAPSEKCLSAEANSPEGTSTAGSLWAAGLTVPGGALEPEIGASLWFLSHLCHAEPCPQCCRIAQTPFFLFAPSLPRQWASLGRRACRSLPEDVGLLRICGRARLLCARLHNLTGSVTSNDCHPAARRSRCLPCLCSAGCRSWAAGAPPLPARDRADSLPAEGFAGRTDARSRAHSFR